MESLFIAYFAVYLVVNAIFSGIVGYVASEKGRSAGAFFALSFFFSFLVGILVVLAVPKIETTRNSYSTPNLSKEQSRKCEHCAEEIKLEAKICKHCGNSVQPLEPTEKAPIRNWCSSCKEESSGALNADCPNCGHETYPYDGYA